MHAIHAIHAITGDSRPGIQRGHSMGIVCNFRGSGGATEDFSILMA